MNKYSEITLSDIKESMASIFTKGWERAIGDWRDYSDTMLDIGKDTLLELHQNLCAELYYIIKSGDFIEIESGDCNDIKRGDIIMNQSSEYIGITLIIENESESFFIDNEVALLISGNPVIRPNKMPLYYH